jgi:hypothetical protein
LHVVLLHFFWRGCRCPSPGCSNSLQLPHGREGSALLEAAAAGRGVDARCACGHLFCWACSEAAHEPATCSQSRAWQVRNLLFFS